jgi:hypothetical protein
VLAENVKNSRIVSGLVTSIGSPIYNPSDWNTGKYSSHESNAAKVSILLTKKLLFLYIMELRNTFINSNQLYVEYICFGCFE